MSNSPRIQRALVSTSDKAGLDELARGLADCGVEIFSTGGTRKFLEQRGLVVRDVSAYTGFPEIMDGRVKTLHPKVHGGILCRHDNPQDREALTRHGILTFELVVVNLYPFADTVARAGVTDDEAIEQIDIGGPSLIRAAAKNHAFTAVATSAAQYPAILAAIRSAGGTSFELRRELAAAAFAHTAAYDTAIAGWFATRAAERVGSDDADRLLPAHLSLEFERQAVLRYGENPHQRAALYAEPGCEGANLTSARQLHGKELSYNNLLDLDSALAIARSLPTAAAVVIKHNNPCGAACATNLADALRRALAADPVSAFGSVLGLNVRVDLAAAEVLCEPGLFVEAIVAPDFDTAAVEALTTRPKWRQNVRLLAVGPLDRPQRGRDYRRIDGGLLVQEYDHLPDPTEEWTVVTQHGPTAAERADLAFAWAVVRQVKSNAIVVARQGQLLGTGAGQMSRIDSVAIALQKAGERARGGVLASDAFFPFPDSIERAAAAGVAALIQPGGSKKDKESIAAADRHGLAMIFTGRRHFKH